MALNRYQVPGALQPLFAKGRLTEEQLAPLLARLPEEQYVQTQVRDGEGLDSTRWPVARDAALAALAARRLPDQDGVIAAAFAAIERAGHDEEAVHALARATFARALAGGGAEGEKVLRVIWSDATPDDLALLALPPLPSPQGGIAQLLINVHQCAVNGMFAYHCHRGLPGPSAEPAAMLIELALDAGVLTVDELVAAAIEQIV
jgi:hypothetical protein